MHLTISRHGIVVALVLGLFGCAGGPTGTATGIDGIACVGVVNQPPEGLVQVKDDALLQKALDASGDGKLCAGKVFLAEEPVTVYRVWNSDKSYTVYGSWWSFDKPDGPKPVYRKDNAICPSWSSLDRMTSCSIKAGTKLVVGPGQSANCEGFTYPKSAVNQVFIPNDSRKDQILVEDCSQGVAWP